MEKKKKKDRKLKKRGEKEGATGKIRHTNGYSRTYANYFHDPKSEPSP